MAEFAKFKLPKFWESVQENEFRVGNLEIINVRSEDVSFNRKLRKIILLKDHLVLAVDVPTTLKINYEFHELPEWAIPFMHVHHVFHTESGFEMNERFGFQSNYLWKQSGSSYILKYHLRGALYNVLTEVPLSLIKAPLFVSLEIDIMNEFVWHEVQQPKD